MRATIRLFDGAVPIGYLGVSRLDRPVIVRSELTAATFDLASQVDADRFTDLGTVLKTVVNNLRFAVNL